MRGGSRSLRSALLVLPALLGFALAAADGAPEPIRHRVVAAYPHDRGAYTQGLVLVDGDLYESTGEYGRSRLRRVDRVTGDVLDEVRLADEYFGEGLAAIGDRLYQLTWRAGKVFVYGRHTLDRLAVLEREGQGWGLAFDGEQLILSDGSEYLYFLDPASLAERRRVAVHDERGPVRNLNELEYVNGYVYANVWQSVRIARISPRDGRVTGWIDLSGLLSPLERRADTDVLNGIAYDPDSGHLLVTGKRWPRLFEIALEPPP
ncbi:MAG: glutaminyl-peptide cyclotransferase [Gammaproteobacteria bacterium]|nr:glutaminyl-peptide cyclotransferase [Gammaproteobacteria bacterium]